MVRALCCMRAAVPNNVRGCTSDATRALSCVPCDAKVETYERLPQRMGTFQQCSNFTGAQVGDGQLLAAFRVVSKKVQERSVA